MTDTAGYHAIDDNDMSSSIDELRMRLYAMRRLADKRCSQPAAASTSSSFPGASGGGGGGGGQEENHWRTQYRRSGGLIDGSFLSVVFGGALVVILSVSVYAFYNLYHAILKKFPSPHTEL